MLRLGAKSNLASPLLLRHASNVCYAVAGVDDKTYYEVPAGHQESDLSSTACNIGLGRRRDLTLRQDLYLNDGETRKPLAEFFKGKLSVVFGVPDQGKVCSEKHVPSYLSKAEDLNKAGVDQIFCVSVTTPASAESWAKSVGLKDSKIRILADESGGFSRLLGVEIGTPSSGSGPKSQRYAALIEDGLLLKLEVEKSLASMKSSSAEHMLTVINDLKNR